MFTDGSTREEAPEAPSSPSLLLPFPLALYLFEWHFLQDSEDPEGGVLHLGQIFFFFLQLGSDPLVLSIVALSLLQLMRTQRKRLCCHEVGRHAKASFKDHETLMMARGQRRSRTR